MNPDETVPVTGSRRVEAVTTLRCVVRGLKAENADLRNENERMRTRPARAAGHGTGGTST